MVKRPILRSSARYLGLYAFVEIAVLALLVWALGLGWTLVVLAATFMFGVLLAASQVKGQVVAARRARANPEAAVADGVLVGVGSFLVFLPGVVTTAAGVLMLAPPTRGAMRPLAATMLTRGVVRRMESLNINLTPGGARAGHGDYIDGDYIDGDYIDGEVIGEVVDQLPARR
ncbi:MAG: FxsA family protein [Mycobacterium sp.]